MKTAFPLIGPYSKNFDTAIDPAVTVNMYALTSDEAPEPALVPTPGLNCIRTLSHGTVGRRMFVFRTNMYAIISQFVWRFDSGINGTIIGELSTDSGYVGIQANEAGQIIFMDGVDAWIWDTAASTFTRVTDPGLLPFPLAITYQDGYFIAGQGDSANWGISGINNGTAWDPTQRAKIESRPDIIVGMATLNREVFIFGTESTEVWQDAGKASFPYERNNLMLFEYGAAAIGAIQEGLGNLVFLASNVDGVSSVMMTNGGNPQPISPPDIDEELANATDISDAQAYIYKINGHTFYSLNLTKANQSWLYDLTTNQWFKQETLDGGRHLPQDHAFFAGKHYVCNYNSPKICEMSPTIYTNDGESIKRQRITTRFYVPSRRYLRVNELTNTVIHGVGLANGKDVMPQVDLRVSTDGGQTFGKTLVASLGRMGERNAFTQWLNLGIAREFVFDIRTYNAVNFILMGGSINYDEVGN